MSAVLLRCFAAKRVLLVAVCLLVAGCGSVDPLVPVHGLVLVDSLPLSGAAVAFQPVDGGPSSVAMTDASGRFSLRTQDGRPGALAGMHRISVLHPEDVRDIPSGTTPGLRNASYGGRRDEPLDIVPRQYASPVTSGLTAHITPGEMEPVLLRLEH